MGPDYSGGSTHSSCLFVERDGLAYPLTFLVHINYTVRAFLNARPQKRA